jgi:hypothetical protein
LSEVNPNHRSWSFVWKTLPGYDTDPGLVGLARGWLGEVNANSPSWEGVWEELPGYNRDPELVGLARKWLNEVKPSSRSWPYIWLKLFGGSVEREDLTDLAARRLRSVDTSQPGWKGVRRALIDHERRQSARHSQGASPGTAGPEDGGQ